MEHSVFYIKILINMFIALISFMFHGELKNGIGVFSGGGRFFMLFFILFCFVLFGLVWFYGISTIVGYLMPNPLYIYIYISNIYDLIWFSFMAYQPL